MNATNEVFTILGLMFGVIVVLALLQALQGPPPKEPPTFAE
ncbi:MAG: hypothetical protein ABL883_03630 [Terricaulis sp.]